MRRRARGQRGMRRYAVLGSVAAGLILFAATSASFLATNGTATASVSSTGSGTAGDVYTPTCRTSSGTTTCTSPTITNITTLDWGATGTGTTTTPQEAAWSAAQGEVTSVTTAGDVAVVDATGGQTLITVTLTNAAAMTGAYTYVNIPIEIYKCALASGTCQMGVDSNQSEQYLTFSDASLTFDVNSGDSTSEYYEVVVPTGGSMYVYSTNTSSDLAADFLVTSQIL